MHNLVSNNLYDFSLNTFTIPFVLQCGHSFCRDCIVEYSNSVRTH